MAFDPLTVAGIAGAVIILMAYFLNQKGSLASDDWRLAFANLLGAVAILLSLTTAWNLPAALIEAAWASISLWSLARTLRRKGWRR